MTAGYMSVSLALMEETAAVTSEDNRRKSTGQI
jgi:hypothetical protein